MGTQSERAGGTSHEPSLAELVKQLSEQSSALARKEVELARLEVTEKAKRTEIGAGMFGGAGILGMATLGALTACFILALNLAVAGWAAALIVAGVYALIAGGLAITGKSNLQKGTPPAPRQAVESTKEDVAWVKDRAKSAKA
jgi:hypothetical protein